MASPNLPNGVKPGDGYMVVILEQTKIKKRISDLEGQRLNDRLSLLEEQNLAENIYKLAKAVEADAKARMDAKSPCWNWPAMTEEEAGDAWDKLLTWRREVLAVRWPTRYWEMTTPCWYLHPEVVEELSALYLTWEYTYTNPDAAPMRAGEFVERWLPGAHARVKLLLSKCYTDGAGGEHKAFNEQTVAWREHDDAQISGHIDRDLAGRQAPAATAGS